MDGNVRRADRTGRTGVVAVATALAVAIAVAVGGVGGAQPAAAAEGLVAPPVAHFEGTEGGSGITVVNDVDAVVDLESTQLAPGRLVREPGVPSGSRTGELATGASKTYDVYLNERYDAVAFVVTGFGAGVDVDLTLLGGYDLDGVPGEPIAADDLLAEESIVLLGATGGRYQLAVHVAAAAAGSTAFDLVAFGLAFGAEEDGFEVPDRIVTTAGQPTTFAPEWQGLAEGRRYGSIIRYDGGDATTLVVIDTRRGPVRESVADVRGTGTEGSADLTWTPEDTRVAATPVVTGWAEERREAGFSGSGGFARYDIQSDELADDLRLLRIDLDAADDAPPGTDFDLWVVRTDGGIPVDEWWADSSSPDERLDLRSVPNGAIQIFVLGKAGSAAAAYTLRIFEVSPGTSDGTFTLDPSTVDARAGVPVAFRASWSGLQPERRYLGLVEPPDGAPTAIEVDAIAAPAPEPSTVVLRVTPPIVPTTVRAGAVVRVVSDGAVAGGTVVIAVAGRRLTATLDADGRAVVRLPLLPRGDHVVRATFSGTETAAAAVAQRTVKVVG